MKPKIVDNVDDIRAAYDAWLEAKDASSAWAIAEKERRAHFMQLAVVGKVQDLEGAATGTFADGTKFGVTFKQNIKLDSGGVEAIQNQLGEAKAAGLFKVSVSINPTAYKKLDDDSLYVVNDFVTVTPALPALSKK